MLTECFNALHAKSPRIHCISNAVSAPLCANGLIALGGAPIMADAPEEVAEITALCSGLSLNLGMPNPRKVEAMLKAGKSANHMGIPVVFDPVGVGASQYRRTSAQALLDTVQFTAIRGNLSEMRVLAGELGQCMGVDAGETVTDENLAQVVAFARAFAQKIGAIIAISSVIDVVTDGNDTYVIRNGHTMLSTLSGSGCLLSVLLTAFLSANPTRALASAVTALCTLGICGERAAQSCTGNGSFPVTLLDEISNLTDEILTQEGQYALF